MVQIFHWNRRLFQHKFSCIITSTLFFIFVLNFEIFYHIVNDCKSHEEIDVVYTWVNGSDPKFFHKLNFYLKKHDIRGDSSSQRFDDKNELKYSLRSLEKYAPWIRHVYIVTNGQIPQWLNLDYHKVTLVTHEDIFENKANLPTFSSPAIETQLHRIPDLSKRFIYFNDDVFLGAPIYPDDFYSPSRGFLIYLAWPLPNCAPECSWIFVGDGHCDEVCNNYKCQNDGDDCDDSFRTMEYKPLNVNRNFTIKNSKNLTSLVLEHNRKILSLDKIKRRRTRKKIYDFDAYSESLQHTNRILNDKYGFTMRKVPSHAPIMIDKEIMNEMQTQFRKFIEKTARNPIRRSDDLQFAFSYYYFLIHEKSEVTIDEIFDIYDTDSSSVWSDNEIRTLVAKLYDLPINDEAFGHFANFLVNCSSRSELSSLKITKTFLHACQPLVTFLEANLGTRHKYKYRIVKEAEKKYVAFKMLNSNLSQVLNQLDDVRKTDKKFVCLNDNLDLFRQSDNKIIKQIMFEFYQALFPKASKFELPDNYRNKYLHIEDLKELEKQQKRHFFLIVLFILFTILFVSTRRIWFLINWLFF